MIAGGCLVRVSTCRRTLRCRRYAMCRRALHVVVRFVSSYAALRVVVPGPHRTHRAIYRPLLLSLFTPHDSHLLRYDEHLLNTLYLPQLSTTG